MSTLYILPAKTKKGKIFFSSSIPPLAETSVLTSISLQYVLTVTFNKLPQKKQCRHRSVAPRYKNIILKSSLSHTDIQYKAHDEYMVIQIRTHGDIL